MPICNEDIAAIFDELADLLEIHDGNPYRIRAYRNAVSAVRNHKSELSNLSANKKPLSKLTGVGADIYNQIHEIIKTGHSPLLNELRTKAPPAFTELLTIPKLSANRANMLEKVLGVRTIAQLRQAAKDGKIRNVPGFGLKAEQLILDSLQAHAEQSNRFKRADVQYDADALTNYLTAAPALHKVMLAGSYRRLKETIGNLDVLITGTPQKALISHFLAYDEIQSVLTQDEGHVSVILHSGLQVNLHLAKPENYGAALCYFTGSNEHNLAMTHLAQKHQLNINEYGVFRGEERVAGETEESVFAALDLPFIHPELRENRGEIEAAQCALLPQLITLAELRGDLHMCSNASNGANSIEEMASKGRELGLDYIAITDRILDQKQLADQIERVDKFNRNKPDITILKGVEVDILPDGTLGLPNSLLQQLDVIIAAIHTQFDLPNKQQTERILRALDNPYVNILAHPTGRLIGTQKPCDIDLPRILKKAKKRRIAIELNGQSDRLDINDQQCQMARDEGVLVCINSGARRATELTQLRLGVNQARRGWLEPRQVLNTRNLGALQIILKFRREL